MRKLRILKTGVTNAPYRNVLEYICQLGHKKTSAFVCIANVHMLVEAWLDERFREILEDAVLVTPDGRPLSFFMDWLYGTRQERIAGPDLMVDLFAKAEQEGLRLFFLGSTEEVLERMALKLRREYPELRLAGMVSPPFRALTPEEDRAIVAQINGSDANIVLVALGCPKQEQWMRAHQGQVNAVMLGVGAAFPFFTGDLNRAPAWMQRVGLEWLFRLASEPRRLFRRYLKTNVLFLLLISAQCLKHRLFPAYSRP